MRLHVGKKGPSVSVGGRGHSVNVPLPKRITFKGLVWANIIGWGGLFLFGWLFHLITAGDKLWKHPAAVVGSGINIHQQYGDHAIIGAVSTGDTLEVHSEPDSEGWVRVSKRTDKGDWEKGESQGVIQKRFLQIPDSTLKQAKSGKIF